MQELIKEIEDAQIKEVTPFNVGDTDFRRSCT